MDVVLVNSKSLSKPLKSDALAQANLDGGGNTDQKLRAASPFPGWRRASPLRSCAPPNRPQAARGAGEGADGQSRRSRRGASRARSPGHREPDTEARDLVDKSLEIERLEAQIRRERQAYQERPKRVFIGARATEYRFAHYVENWRLRIERIGSLNYPEEARARRIYGSLQLTVAIKADGEVESVEINRSSGYRFLDQAAIRIVRLAAPFDRFPANIRGDTDILHITRTWTFTRTDRCSRSEPAARSTRVERSRGFPGGLHPGYRSFSRGRQDAIVLQPRRLLHLVAREIDDLRANCAAGIHRIAHPRRNVDTWSFTCLMAKPVGW